MKSRLSKGLLSHVVRLRFEAGVVVDGDAAFELHRRLYPALALLYDMPGFMGKMPLLPRRNMNVVALRIGEGVKLCGPAGLEVDPDVGQIVTGQALHIRLQLVGHAGLVFDGAGGLCLPGGP